MPKQFRTAGVNIAKISSTTGLLRKGKSGHQGAPISREDMRQIGALYTQHRDRHYECAAALRMIEALAEDAASALRQDGDGLLYLDVARERIQSIRNSVHQALSE